MKKRENASKRGVQGMNSLFYGMNGVGKQTNSTLCFIKRGFIGKAVDGKGIWIS